LIEINHKDIPIYRQCELLGLSRSSFYYSSSRDDSLNEHLMRLIDEQYTKTPFYGILKMTAWLNFQGHLVNHKRVARLMRLMGIEAIYPKPRLSKPDNKHRKYPYLLKNIDVIHPDQVWASDITYIRMHRGFVYLTAIMDWFSRFVLSWELSINLDTDFCLVALEKAFSIGRPGIFNSDQGPQYTSLDFTGRLEREGVQISMGGRGRVFDNIFVERLWRTVKYEEVFLKDYRSVSEAREGIGNYFEFYNAERFHQSLGYKTPSEVYRGYGQAPKVLARPLLDTADSLVSLDQHRQLTRMPPTGTQEQGLKKGEKTFYFPP